MKMQKLGKGLSALLNTSQTIQNDSDYLQFIDIDLIEVNPDQPRKNIDEEKVYQLSESIKANGLLQPIVVTKINERYKIVAGERRYRACKLIELESIPCIIRNTSNAEILEIAIIENIQRENLNPIEEAEAYVKLINDFGYTQEDLAKNLCKSRSYVANTLRLNNLSQEVKEKVIDGTISAGHAKALIGIENPTKILDGIVRDDLSVRQVEILVKKTKGEKRKNHLDSNIIDEDLFENEELQKIAENISIKLGVKVYFTKKNSEYKMEFSFEDLKYLDLILSRLS